MLAHPFHRTDMCDEGYNRAGYLAVRKFRREKWRAGNRPNADDGIGFLRRGAR